MIKEMMPRFLVGQELMHKLLVLPDYNKGIRQADASVRLLELDKIYRLHIPSMMSAEIYTRIYTAVRMSLDKKESRLMAKQQNFNHQGMATGKYYGVIGGSDSFAIIGPSGVGKSSAVARSIELIDGDSILRFDMPLATIIPCLTVQCPFDASSKGLLLEILRAVDERLGTDYYLRSRRTSVTTDTLIGMVSQVGCNHIGLLVIDEIQVIVERKAKNKNGLQLINLLTQLINNSGISICMVGTPECIPFFENTFKLARRSLGLMYSACPFNEYFRNFCVQLFQYQYTIAKTELSPAILNWLYIHSQGVVSLVVSIFHDAQEIAILKGTEQIDINVLNEAFDKRMTMMHSFINLIKIKTVKAKKEKMDLFESEDIGAVVNSSDLQQIEKISIEEIVARAKSEKLEVVQILAGYISIEKVVL